MRLVLKKLEDKRPIRSVRLLCPGPRYDSAVRSDRPCVRVLERHIVLCLEAFPSYRIPSLWFIIEAGSFSQGIGCNVTDTSEYYAHVFERLVVFLNYYILKTE